jgi:hypothetical protein
MLSDIVSYFREYYRSRRLSGQIVEKANSMYLDPEVSDKSILMNILANPYKRFEYMGVMRHTKTLGIIEVDTTVWKNLDDNDKAEIERISNEKLDEYYERVRAKQ